MSSLSNYGNYEYMVIDGEKPKRRFRTLHWQTEPPKESGVYWMRAKKWYKNDYTIEIADVSVMDGVISFNSLTSGYECENDYCAEDVSHWLGPIPIPALPKEGG